MQAALGLDEQHKRLLHQHVHRQALQYQILARTPVSRRWLSRHGLDDHLAIVFASQSLRSLLHATLRNESAAERVHGPAGSACAD
jgi:hypothetical protein